MVWRNMPSMEKATQRDALISRNGDSSQEIIVVEANSINEQFNGVHNGNGNFPMLEVQISSAATDVVSSSEDFFDPQELLSVASASSVEADDNISLLDRSMNMSTPRAEFFDAPEDAFELSSESGTQISLCEVEADELLEEIQRRKQAEETRDVMQRQWQRLEQRLSLEGLAIPSASTIAIEDEKSKFDPAGDLCQQISLARAVSTSIGREAAKAEAEMELEAKLESKNFEIDRLQKRLQYYEAVNHEISLRNLEASEIERSPRKRRKRRQRWIWSSIGVSIMLGSAALAWSFLTSAKESPPTDTSHALEGGHAANELPD